MNYWRSMVAILAFATSVPALAEVVSNRTIMALNSAGLSDGAIIAKIAASETRFDTSSAVIMDMTQKGVSGAVIAAMIEKANVGTPQDMTMAMNSPDPMVARPTGLYILQDRGFANMQRIDPTVSSQSKTGGIFGFALTGGIATMSGKATIANESARITAQNRQPTFYFFFDEANAPSQNMTSQWNHGSVRVATSPNELVLVKLMEKKGRREARMGSLNIAGRKHGVMDKDRISFSYEMVRLGVYKAYLPAALTPGEYAFVMLGAGDGTSGASAARLYDFRVE